MRRLLAPRWVAAHLLVAVVVPAFIALGFWQLSRHEDRADYNASVREGLARPEVPLGSLLPLDEGDAYRRVEVEGRWGQGEVLLGPRSRAGQPGYHVLTPFEPEAGGVLLVDRGWVGYDTRLPLPERARVEGTATLVGVVLPDEAGARFVTVPARGRPEIVSSVQAAEIGRRLALDAVLPGTLLLEQPATAPLPPATLPEPDAGPHVSYAVQWFLFAAVVAIGYPLALWRTLRAQGTQGVNQRSPLISLAL